MIQLPSIFNFRRLQGLLAFLLAVLCAEIVWHYLIRGFTAHHANSAAAQGIANVT